MNVFLPLRVPVAPAVEESRMTNSPEPAVAGVEELHFSIPVAGSDRR
ncbi:hypothetical protein ACIQVA_30130 [Streptomyces microflavus]